MDTSLLAPDQCCRCCLRCLLWGRTQCRCTLDLTVGRLQRDNHLLFRPLLLPVAVSLCLLQLLYLPLTACVQAQHSTLLHAAQQTVSCAAAESELGWLLQLGKHGMQAQLVGALQQK